MIAYNPALNRNITSGKLTSLTIIRLRCLFLLVFSIPFFRLQPFGSPYFSLPFIFTFLYLGLCIISRAPFFYLKGLIGIAFPAMVLIVLLLTMTSLNNFSGSKMAYSDVRQFILYFTLTIAIVNEIRSRPFLANILLFFFFLSLCLISLFYLAGIGVVEKNGRISIFNLNANGLGLYYMIAFLILLKIFFEENLSTMKKWILLIFAVIFLFIIVRTGSRTSVVCLFIGLAFYLISFKLPFRKKIAFLLVGITLAIILAFLMFNSDIIEQRFLDERDDKSLGSRLPIWEATIPIIYENPWFGNGASGYEKHITSIRGSYVATHNIYLWVLVEAGIVGSIFFLWFIFGLGRASILVNRTMGIPFFLVIWVSYMVYFSTGGGILMTFEFWFIMALLIGNYLVVKENSIKK